MGAILTLAQAAAGGWSLMQMIVIAVIVAAVIAIAVVGIRAMGLNNPILGRADILDRCDCRRRDHSDQDCDGTLLTTW